MIKMIVTDLDETLLRSDKTISQYTIDTLRNVKHKGIKIIFATARGGSMRSLIPYELFDGYVLMNGAKAYINNHLVYNKMIPAEVFKPFLHILSEHNLKVAAEVNGVHKANFDVREKWPYVSNFVIMNDLNDISDGADKLYAIIEHPDQVDIIQSNLPEEVYLNVSRDGLAMIMHHEAKKMNGIVAIANQLNITPREIVAFGDDVNDKDMLLNCGLSVAMGNALDEIKAISDDICLGNDDDGVAHWIENNILLKD